jgi:hypothetical protein
MTDKDNIYRNGENGVQRQTTRYDNLDAQRDGKFPVRDNATGHPVGPDGKTDWARVIRESNQSDNDH